jgi:cell division transport system permease protein
MACLVIIGCAAMLFVNINHMLDTVEKENVVLVFLKDGLSQAEIDTLGETLKTTENLDSQIEFISKEEAWEQEMEKLGDDAVLFEGITQNLLPDSFKVTVTDLARFDETVARVRALPNVESIREHSDIADKLLNVRRALLAVSAGIIALLLVVSLFIIANTVRVTMYSRRREISIMKAVGATNSFIRWPFMIEGIVLGLFAGLFALLVAFLIYTGAKSVLTSLFDIFDSGIVPFVEFAGPLLLVFAVIGVGTGGLGSLLSMNKYLKEQGGVVSEE